MFTEITIANLIALTVASIAVGAYSGFLHFQKNKNLLAAIIHGYVVANITLAIGLVLTLLGWAGLIIGLMLFAWFTYDHFNKGGSFEDWIWHHVIPLIIFMIFHTGTKLALGSGFKGSYSESTDPPSQPTTESPPPLAQRFYSKLIYLDENVYFMAAALRRMGFEVIEIIPGTKDPAIIEMIKAKPGILVTRNFRDFKSIDMVVRTSEGVDKARQQILVINALNAIKINPEIWIRMRHVPASGLNSGSIRPPQQVPPVDPTIPKK